MSVSTSSSDPTFACPNCGSEIKLIESLAAPLLAATKKDYEKRLADQSAIVEAFTDMEADLAKEKKAITRQWAKRETQITRVMEATVGMYGEMQGIAGKSVLEIEGLELNEFEDQPAPLLRAVDESMV